MLTKGSDEVTDNTRPVTKPGIEIHPLSILRMLWKHKLLMVFVWAVVSVAGVAFVRTLPNVYRAESLILVDSQRIPERFVASTVQMALQDHLAMISQQILSATQLEKTIQKYQLYPNLRRTASPEQITDQMRKEIVIELEKGWTGGRSGAFRISYVGPDPTVVANVVNEISGMFIAENLKAREMRAEDTSQFIESQLREARKGLEEQELHYSQFKLQRMGELPQQEGALSGTLNRLQAELQGNQDAINRAEQNKVLLENTLRVAESAEAMAMRAVRQASVPQPTATTVVRPDFGEAPTTAAVAVAVVPRSETLRRQLGALRVRYGDEHPEIKRLKRELETALGQELQEGTVASQTAAALVPAPPVQEGVSSPAHAVEVTAAPSVSPLLVAELNRERERVAETKTQLAFAVKESNTRVTDRQRILGSIAGYQAKLDRLPMREQELASVTRDYENSKQNYRSLLDKKLSAEMAAEMERRQQAERFTLQDPARVPGRPIKPNRPVLNGVAAGLGLFIGLVWALGIEIRKSCFLGEWELPAGISVLGRVPIIVIADSAKSASPDSIGQRAKASMALLLVAAVLTQVTQVVPHV